MNLVDAIRKASQNQFQAVPAPELPGEPLAAHDFPASSTDPDVPIEEVTAFTELVESAQHNNAMNLVRMELFLTPEQTHSLLRGALNTHRAVMTSREVAGYLRMHHHTVEEMAAAGDLPGFRVEDSWRFMKASVDEWMNQQVNRGEEGNTNAA